MQERQHRKTLAWPTPAQLHRKMRMSRKTREVLPSKQKAARLPANYVLAIRAFARTAETGRLMGDLACLANQG